MDVFVVPPVGLLGELPGFLFVCLFVFNEFLVLEGRLGLGRRKEQTDFFFFFNIFIRV